MPIFMQLSTEISVHIHVQKVFLCKNIIKIIVRLPRGAGESWRIFQERPRPIFSDRLSHTASNIFASRNVSI